MHTGRCRRQMVTVAAKFEWNDPVSKHMHREFPRLSSRQTVGEALAWMRRHPPPGRIIYFYVVDEENRLKGVVPVRRLVLSQPEAAIDGIMVPRVIAVPATANVLEACEFFILHRLLAFPVVDESGTLQGVVDVDLFTKGLSESGPLGEGPVPDDLFQM